MTTMKGKKIHSRVEYSNLPINNSKQLLYFNNKAIKISKSKMGNAPVVGEKHQPWPLG